MDEKRFYLVSVPKFEFWAGAISSHQPTRDEVYAALIETGVIDSDNDYSDDEMKIEAIEPVVVDEGGNQHVVAFRYEDDGSTTQKVFWIDGDRPFKTRYDHLWAILEPGFYIWPINVVNIE